MSKHINLFQVTFDATYWTFHFESAAKCAKINISIIATEMLAHFSIESELVHSVNSNHSFNAVVP